MRTSRLLFLATLAFLPPPVAELAITSLTDTPDPVDLGSRVTYRIVAKNFSGTPRNVTVTDTISAGATFLSCTATAGGTCRISTDDPGLVAVTYPVLSAGTTSTITLVARVPASLEPGAVVHSSAWIGWAGSDKNLGNNARSTTTTVKAPAAPFADVGVAMTASPAEVMRDSTVTYTVTVSNAGASVAEGVTLTDTLPEFTTFRACTASGGGVCSGAGDVHTVTFATLAPGAAETVTLEALVDQAAALRSQLTAAASVRSESPVDPFDDDNRATASVTVIGSDVRDKIGEWSAPQAWPSLAINLHMLPTGRVLGYDHRAIHVMDPATGDVEALPPLGTNLFCSGHAFLPDGRLLIAGGEVSRNYEGTNTVFIFDPETNGFWRGPPMNAGRWYPTLTTLPNGEVLVTSGTTTSETKVNTLPQVWTTANTWRSLTGAQRTLPLYPWSYVAPDGRVFFAGPNRQSRYLDTRGTGSWTDGPRSQYGARDYGTSVMYEEGKILILGGGDNAVAPTATGEVVDLIRGGGWRYTKPMAFPRRHANATLLPNGKVLVTGGTRAVGFNDATGAVMAAELWDPVTEQWTTVASMSVRRLYHATTVLLPDGRVLSAGGGYPPATGLTPPDTDHHDYEIYSPPYLFQADGSPAVRPTITAAPATIQYGQTFFVETPDAARIARATLLSLSSTTHDVNMGQRINRLTFTSASGGLNLTAPPNANLAPPGVYMLFLLDAAGVPSVARMATLQ